MEFFDMISPTALSLPANPLPILGILASLLAWLFLKSFTVKNSKIDSRKHKSEGNEPFVTPLPNAILDDPTVTPPKLYRPFRHGPNFITMGIRKLGWDNWIEMDSYFLRYHDMKAAELKKEFHEHVKYVDNEATRDACFELNEELVRYLTHRYPKVYRLEGGKVHNSLTSESFAFPAGMIDTSDPSNCTGSFLFSNPR
jgi:hypothetical protein